MQDKLWELFRAKPHLIRFICAGIANTVVHFIIFVFLEWVGISVTASNVLAFLCANIFSFFVASYFVFQVRVRSLQDYIKFFSVSLVGVLLSWQVGVLCTRWMLHPYFAVLGVVLLGPPISYVLQRLVFWGRKGKPASL